jgi:hypothetical protein
MLDPAMFSWLQQKADKDQKTIGSLVRLLLEKAYQSDVDQIKKDRLKAMKSVQKLRSKIHFDEPIDYKELINDGRKY